MEKSNRLRIAAVSSVTVQHGILGGMERYFNAVVTGLAGLGHSVTVITTQMPAGDGGGPLRLHPLPVPVDSKGKAWRRELRNYFSGPPGAAADVILSNSFAAYPLAGLCGPIVTIAQGSGWVDLISSARLVACGQGSAGALARQILRLASRAYLNQRRLLHASSHVVAVSAETGASLERVYGIAAGKIDIIPAPVDTSVFYPKEEPSPPLEASRPLHILSAGTLSRQKGFDCVLEALALLDHRRPGAYRLTVAGQGPEMPRLKAKAGQLGIAGLVLFAGALGEQDLARAFRRSDLFVLATFREEGFPLVIAEALASGVPVITTRVGGNPSAVRDGIDGRLVDAGKPRDLASAIEGLAGDAALCCAMAQNGRKRALSELDTSVVARKTEELLQQVVATTSGEEIACPTA
ncbi:MAG: glycosyltransferase family 4 protein [Acidobacteria bacterium]|nr:glycosyltransferase family 4 protein [Acidobacteriota bacterium]